jgi:hypothetical protein
MLHLCYTGVTDAGLEHLKGLSNLEALLLNGTHVTDAGLEHLKELTNLEWLAVRDTRVTDEGADRLKQKLPQCSIQH